MKNMRNLKLVMKNSMLTPEVKYQLLHMEKNVINVDTTTEESFEDNGTIENEFQQDQYVMVNDHTQMDITKNSARFDLDTDEGTVKGKRENRFSKKDKKRFSAEKLKKSLNTNMMRSVERDREGDESPFDHTGRQLNVPMGHINTSGQMIRTH